MAGRKRKILLFVLDCQTRNSEGVFEKKNNFRRGGGGGVTEMEFRRHGGGRAFWKFLRQGGVKFRCHPWYGTDIFWNRPIGHFHDGVTLLQLPEFILFSFSNSNFVIPVESNKQ